VRLRNAPRVRNQGGAMLALASASSIAVDRQRAQALQRQPRLRGAEAISKRDGLSRSHILRFLQGAGEGEVRGLDFCSHTVLGDDARLLAFRTGARRRLPRVLRVAVSCGRDGRVGGPAQPAEALLRGFAEGLALALLGWQHGLSFHVLALLRRDHRHLHEPVHFRAE